jgi:alpha-1,3-rhamnosyl/mannosyltransferase
MKVILSIDPIRFPLTGIGRYTLELARHLKNMPEVENLHLFSGHGFTPNLPELEHTKQSSTTLTHSFRRSILRNRLTVELYHLASPIIKRHALRGHSDFIFHGPNFYLPPFGGRSICTFHDISIFTFSRFHPSERVRYMRKEIAHTLKRADMLITDSEYTRHEIASYFNWPLDKIRSVSLACSSEFRPRTLDEMQPRLSSYGLISGQYCLYVGTIEPRKNLDTLLDAYALLPKTIKKQWPLVLIGHNGWHSEQLHERIKSAINEGWAFYFGFVDANDLPVFYSGARLFVFPSLYEGFGLPVLEAMSSGIPVVCSSASSLPEVTGDAAAMFEPLDVETLSELITIGLEDNIWRASAQEKGLLRASNFSWKKCAEETVKVYREVAL